MTNRIPIETIEEIYTCENTEESYETAIAFWARTRFNVNILNKEQIRGEAA